MTFASEGTDIKLRVNIGCGQAPKKGWVNYDNSFGLRLSRIPFLPELLRRTHIIDAAHLDFIRLARNNGIEYGDATKRLPLPDATVDVIYNSHMLEHLDRDEADAFLKEARRLLRPGGSIQIVIPDIRIMAQQYIEDGDADAFMTVSCLCVPRPRTFLQKMRFLLVGNRHHQWMYDEKSLCALLQDHGFVGVKILSIDKAIDSNAPLGLKGENVSVYVEARQPLS